MQESMYKNSQWPEFERHKYLFIMSVMRFSCLHVHTICAKLFVSSMNIALVKCLLKIMQYIYDNHLSADGK